MTTLPNSQNVRYETYLSWNVHDSFDADVAEVDGRRIVAKLWCKTCRKFVDKIRCDARLRGRAKIDNLQFAEGSTNVVKCAVIRHLTSVVRITKPIASHRPLGPMYTALYGTGRCSIFLAASQH